jgi:hypothetical protein
MPEILSSKTTGILVDTLKETFKSLDLSLALGFTAALFIVLHGLHDDYSSHIRRTIHLVERQRISDVSGVTSPVPAQTGRPVTPPTSEISKGESEAKQISVPFFGFAAGLYEASAVALISFWVFCIRAGFQVRRARVIASRLSRTDRDAFDIMCLWPSMATTTTTVKVLLGFVFAGAGYAAQASYFGPLEPHMGSTPLLILLFELTAVIPACYLTWGLVSFRTKPVSPAN